MFRNSLLAFIFTFLSLNFLIAGKSLNGIEFRNELGQMCKLTKTSGNSFIENFLKINNQECAEWVAGSYPTYDQRLNSLKACQGVIILDCPKWVAGSYPTFDQRINASQACNRINNMKCPEWVAGSYPTFDQRVAATKACIKVESDECPKWAAGNYPTFDQRINSAISCQKITCNCEL